MFGKSAVSLAVFLLLWVFSCGGWALEVQAERGAVIVHVQGKVWLQSQGKKSPATENARAYVGDAIATESASRAIVLLDGSTTVRLDEKTSLTIASPSQENSFWCKVRVSSGRIWMEVNRLLKGEKKRDPIEVETPTGLAAVHGTVLQVDVEGNESEITVHEGSVQIGDQEIQSGETGRMTPRGFRRGEYKLGKFAEWNFEEALQAQSKKMEKVIRLILQQYITNPKAKERMSRWIVAGTIVEQTPQELVVSVSAGARKSMKKAQKMRQRLQERRSGKKSGSSPETSEQEGDSELVTMRIPKEKLEGIVVYVDGQASTLEAVRPGQPF
ncbi:MAG: FecR domain-containing protein, partial [Armatimonadetes bacterium]|nr:FecR domain-containing protein [Armatimonadota bacterium]